MSDGPHLRAVAPAASELEPDKGRAIAERYGLDHIDLGIFKVDTSGTS